RSVAQPWRVTACFLSCERCLRSCNSFVAGVFSRPKWTYLAHRAATDRFRGIFVIRRPLLCQARAIDCASARGMAGKKPCQRNFGLADKHDLLANRVAFARAYNRFRMRRPFKLAVQIKDREGNADQRLENLFDNAQSESGNIKAAGLLRLGHL